MKHIDQQTLDKLCIDANTSTRRRSHLNLHEHSGEDIQRLLIGLQPGTYVRPHLHPETYKKETIVILQGRCACVTFNEDGSIASSVILDKDGANLICEFPDRQWHSLVCLEKDTVVLEFKRGPYVALSPENFAAWAPPENSSAQDSYLKELSTKILS